jgi:hypothetical protein
MRERWLNKCMNDNFIVEIIVYNNNLFCSNHEDYCTFNYAERHGQWLQWFCIVLYFNGLESLVSLGSNPSVLIQGLRNEHERMGLFRSGA